MSRSVQQTGSSTDKGSSKLTFASMLAQGNAHPVSSSQRTQLEELRLKFNERFVKKQTVRPRTEQASQPTRPFFADVSNNTFAILASDTGETVPDAWNALVGEFGRGEEKLRVEEFKLERTKNDTEVSNFCAVFATRIKEGDLREDFWNDTSERSRLSKLMVATIASEYWLKHVKFDPLVPPEYLDITRKEREPKAAYERRKVEFMKSRIPRYHNLLAKAIQDSLVHKHAREESLSLTYLIRKAYTHCPNTSRIDEYILSIQKLSPTVAQLRRLGKIPDMKVGEFKNLFLLSEWEQISQSKLFKAETELKEKLKEKISPASFLRFYDDLRKLAEDVRENILAMTILETKKTRLVKATIWKRDSIRPNDTMNVLHNIHRHSGEEGILNTFSPFKLLAACNCRGSEEGLTRVKYDSNRKSFYWEEIPIEGSSEPVEKAGREFVALLNQ